MDLLVKLKQNAREDSCDADEAAPCCDDRPESMALKQRLSNPCQSTRGGCGQPTSQCNCKSVTCTCASAAEPVKPAIKEDKEPSIHEAEASTIEQTPPDHDAELDRPEAYESSLARLGRCESCPTMQRAESSCAEDKGPCKHAGGCADRRCRHMNPMSLGCGRPSSTMNCRNATIQTDVNGLDSKEDHSISCGVNTPVRLSKKRLSAATYPPKRSSRRSSDSAKVRSSGSKKSKFPSTHSRCSKRLRGSSHHTSAPSREPSTRKSSLQQSSPQHQASLSTSSLAESVSDEASKKTDEIVRSCLKQDRPCRQSSLDPADLASPLPPRNSFQHSSRASNESLQVSPLPSPQIRASMPCSSPASPCMPPRPSCPSLCPKPRADPYPCVRSFKSPPCLQQCTSISRCVRRECDVIRFPKRNSVDECSISTQKMGTPRCERPCSPCYTPRTCPSPSHCSARPMTPYRPTSPAAISSCGPCQRRMSCCTPPVQIRRPSSSCSSSFPKPQRSMSMCCPQMPPCFKPPCSGCPGVPRTSCSSTPKPIKACPGFPYCPRKPPCPPFCEIQPSLNSNVDQADKPPKPTYKCSL
uniref:Granulin n=1 Tax=Mesocestoides corti TaxID=53468 RepID=A0A5K3FC37_MESCO